MDFFIRYPTLCAILLGFILDLLWGDPQWILHPVVLIGRLISALDVSGHGERRAPGRRRPVGPDVYRLDGPAAAASAAVRGGELLAAAGGGERHVLAHFGRKIAENREYAGL